MSNQSLNELKVIRLRIVPPRPDDGPCGRTRKVLCKVAMVTCGGERLSDCFMVEAASSKFIMDAVAKVMEKKRAQMWGGHRHRQMQSWELVSYLPETLTPHFLAV